MSEGIDFPTRECETYYRDKGRAGEPCGAFSRLTAASTDVEIRTSANAALERIRATVHSPAEESVFREIGEILAAFARAYVAGLREREGTEYE